MTRVPPCRDSPRQTIRPVNRASSRDTVQQFPWSLLLPRIPPPQGLLYSEHIPSTTQPLPRSQLLTRTPISSQGRSFPLRARHSEQGSYRIDLIDHCLQLNQQDFLKLRSSLHRQVIPCVAHCNSTYTDTDGYRRQLKSLPTMKDVIRAVMKKFPLCKSSCYENLHDSHHQL